MDAASRPRGTTGTSVDADQDQVEHVCAREDQLDQGARETEVVGPAVSFYQLMSSTALQSSFLSSHNPQVSSKSTAHNANSLPPR